MLVYSSKVANMFRTSGREVDRREWEVASSSEDVR